MWCEQYAFATFDNIQQHSTTFDNIRQHSTTFDNIRQHSTTFDNIRQHSPIGVVLGSGRGGGVGGGGGDQCHLPRISTVVRLADWFRVSLGPAQKIG